jgi:hypothetical protein
VLVLDVAPNGNRSGFALATAGGRTLSVLVLPKVWRAASAPVVFRVADDRPHTSVVAHEGDRLIFTERHAPHVEALRRATATDPVHRGRHDGPSPLFLLGSGERGLGDHGPAPTPTATDHASLLSLALLGHRLDRFEEVTGSFDEEDDDGPAERLVAALHKPSSPIAALLQGWRLARAVEGRLRDLRRGYAPHEEWRPTVRGRLMTAGLVRYAATGLPSFLCAFEEFTDAIPLFQVVVTALDHVGVRARTGVFASSGLAMGVARDAGRLRHHLGTVPAVSLGLALSTGRRLRLPRLLGHWAPVVRLCVQILEGRQPGAGAARLHAGRAHTWIVNTPRLWELLLARSLAVAVGARGRVVDGNTSNADLHCPGPWDGVGKAKRPDLALSLDPVRDAERCERWVIDAKYKLGADPLPMEDQYQLFAYSRLALVHGFPVTAAALVRPGEPTAAEHARRGPDAFCLSLLTLPFPSAAAAQSDAAWAASVARMAYGWQAGLRIEALPAMLAAEPAPEAAAVPD